MKRLINRTGISEKIVLIILFIILIICIFGPSLAPYPPEEIHLVDKHLPPSFMGGKEEYLLGTDELGRDLLSRMLQATRISMSMALVGTLVGSFVGIVLGLSSGYFGGFWDKIVITLINVQQSIPYVFFVLVIIVILGRETWVILLAVSFSGWNSYARYIRGLVKSIKEEEFIDAARTYKASSFRIIRLYILPNCLSLIIVLITLNFPGVLLLESSLSFLGIGVQPPIATLGQMVGTGRNYMMMNMWLALLPSSFIVAISASVMTLGEWLQVSSNKNALLVAEVDDE